MFFPLRTKNSEGCVQEQIRPEHVCGVVLHISLLGTYGSLNLAHFGGCDRSVCGASLMGVVAVGINLYIPVQSMGSSGGLISCQSPCDNFEQKTPTEYLRFGPKVVVSFLTSQLMLNKL